MPIIQVTEKNKKNISKVSWGETSGLYPTKNTTNPTESEIISPSKWDNNKTKELLEARSGIDYIKANRNSNAHSDDLNLNDPSENRLAPYHLKDNFPEVATEIKNDPTVQFFYISNYKMAKHTGISSKYWEQKAVKIYGPFFNNGGGDVPRGPTYIIFYAIKLKKTN